VGKPIERLKTCTNNLERESCVNPQKQRERFNKKSIKGGRWRKRTRRSSIAAETQKNKGTSSKRDEGKEYVGRQFV